MASSATRFMRPACRRLAAQISRRCATTTTVTRLFSTTPAVLRVVPPEGSSGSSSSSNSSNSTNEMGVGELEGAKFRIEPMRRVGESDKTMRARLTYQSRKRGTLESDLLLSTFADAYLPAMTREQMAQYDRFLDENDWDIYYWATQDSPPPPPPPSSSSSTTTTTTTTTSSDPSYGSGAEAAIAASSVGSSSPPSSTSTTAAAGEEEPEGAAQARAQPYSGAGSGEWAQTVGTFKPAYRPVPARWRGSEVLRLLREHVRRRAGERGGMAFMPALKP